MSIFWSDFPVVKLWSTSVFAFGRQQSIFKATVSEYRNISQTVCSLKLKYSTILLWLPEKQLTLAYLCHLSCTVTCIRASNWVWIYTKAALMEKAGVWLRGATDCVYSYVMWREDFYREVWEKNYYSAFSHSFISQLRFNIARPQQMFSKHTD